MAPRLTVSLVIYRTPAAVLAATLDSLARAAEIGHQHGHLGDVSLALVNNDTARDSQRTLWQLLSQQSLRIFHQRSLYGGQGNVGYGMGHNRVLLHTCSDYHLVLNPDVLLAPEALSKALSFMDTHREVGLLAPRAYDDRGQLQYLCKRYPSVMVLLLRGFAPAVVRRRFQAMLHRYEMRDLLGDDHSVWNIPIASGCFMLFRTTVARQANGFSPRFFLYFEDFDLSLRVGQISRTVYVPTVRIVHLGGQAARKGWRHIRWFGQSMVRFFSCHGWSWY